MDPIRFAILKPVTVSVGVLLTVLAGVISLGVIPIQLTPDIDTTVISVSTRWEGASPQEIETDVVSQQEEKLKGITGLEKMTSTCSLGEGNITLEFRLGTSKAEALRDTSDRLREVSGYPDNVDEPVVRATNPADRDYIAWVVVASQNPQLDIRTLSDFFEDYVEPELERVEGVAEINILGGFEREAQVVIDPVALANRGIPWSRLVTKLQTQNRSASAGQIEEGKRDVRLRSVGRYDQLDQIEATLLSDPGAPMVRVADVGQARLGFKEPSRLVRSRGQRVLAINAQREVGSNVIATMAGFRERLQWIRDEVIPAEERRLGFDVGTITFEQVYDQTIYIDQALFMVRQNLWVGGVLAAMVLLLFLRSVRSTLIIALAIPISVIGTFAVMTVLGRNINVISLAGLAFAVGMVVDNAIVVLENIDRHRRMGKDASRAALDATREVWGAVLASTLTTVAVFVPVLLVQEEAGQLFRDIALAICAAVILSLVVSITVIPAAASRWLGQKRMAGSESSPKAWSRRLSRFIEMSTRSWLVRLSVASGLTLVSVVLSLWLMPPSDYLPGGNRNLIFAMLFPPPGYNLDQKESLGVRVEQTVRPFWEAAQGQRDIAALPKIESMDFATGQMQSVDVPPVENFFFVAVPDRVFMGATSVDPANVRPVTALLNQAQADLPGVRGFAVQMPLFRVASRGAGSGIELELSGQDLREVTDVALRLMGPLSEKYGRVVPSPADFADPGEELRVRLRPVESADVGLSQLDLDRGVQLLGDGLIIGDYLDQGDTIDLKLMVDPAISRSLEYFGRMPLATSSGHQVTLDTVATVSRVPAPQQINRVEELPSITFEISLPPTVPLEAAKADIDGMVQNMRDSGEIAPTVRHRLSGTAAKLGQVKKALLGEWTGLNGSSLYALLSSRLFLALLVVFMLMAALFESWVYPLVIMFSVPLATVGGFLGLRLVHEFVPEQQLDILTMLGFVILIGVVVNNAILIVHQSLNLMEGRAEIDGSSEPMEPHRAIAEAVVSRVRPIFMSTLTSVGGMLPLVLNPGAGSELYRGLGGVVVGGLIVSTLFTLVLVPMLLSIVFDVRAKLLGRRVQSTG